MCTLLPDFVGNRIFQMYIYRSISQLYIYRERRDVCREKWQILLVLKNIYKKNVMENYSTSCLKTAFLETF